jgi:hypothetical protein
MPQLAAAAAGVVAKDLALKYGAKQLTASIVGGLVSAGTSYLLAPKPKAPEQINKDEFTYDRSGIKQVAISGVMHHSIVYGKRIVGGVLANRTATASVKGERVLESENQYINSYQAIAAHKIESIENYYVNEEEVIVNSNGYIYEKDNVSFSNDDKYNQSFLEGNILTNARIEYLNLSDGRQVQGERSSSYGRFIDNSGSSIYGRVYALKNSDINLLVESVYIKIFSDPRQIADPTLDYNTTPLFYAGESIQVKYYEYEFGYNNQVKTLTLAQDSEFYSSSNSHKLTFISNDQLPAKDPLWTKKVFQKIVVNRGQWNETEYLDEYYKIEAQPDHPDWPRKNILDSSINSNSVGFIESLLGDTPQRPTYRMAEGANMGIDKTALNNYEFGNNLALIYSRFRFVEGVFSSFPEVKAKIKGALCYDPRSSTTAWTDNPALIARDYLVSSYGFNIDESRIDDSYTIAAANICDEILDVGDGETQKKYTCNLVLDTSNDHNTNIRKILDTMFGNVVRVENKFRIFAGAYITPTVTIDETYLDGGLSLSSNLEVRNVYNAIKGVFVNEDNNYTITDFKEQTNASYIQEDGRKIYQDLTLEGVTNHKQAQRLAQMHLKKSRFFGTVIIKCNDKAKELSVNDNVYLNIDYLGYQNKVFKIVSLTFGENFNGVNLVLEEDDPSIYVHDDNLVNLSIAQPPTVAPLLAPTNLAVEESIFIVEGLNKVDTKLIVTFSPSSSSSVVTYQVEHKQRGDSAFQVSGRTQSNLFEILNTRNGFYTVRVKAIDSLGRSSEFATIEFQAFGLIDTPSDIQNLKVEQSEGRAFLSWGTPTDLDVLYGGHVIIKHNRDTTANWSESPILLGYINAFTNSATVPAITGKYLIKAVDSGGRESANATEVLFTKAEITDFNTALTLTENPTFTGNKTNMIVIDSLLQLEGEAFFDDINVLFDDALGLFDSGNLTGYKNLGTYEFGLIDLGAVMSVTLESFIKYTQGDLDNYFDSKLGLFDDAIGLFDGDDDNNTYVTTAIFAATTNDDPNGTPTWSDWKEFVYSDFNCRGLKFKLEVSKTLNTANIFIEELKIITSIKNKVDDGTVTTSGTTSTTVNFNKTFYNVPTVVPVIQGAHQSDHVEITNVTKTSFDITTYHGGGIQSKNVYWIAKGY